MKLTGFPPETDDDSEDATVSPFLGIIEEEARLHMCPANDEMGSTVNNTLPQRKIEVEIDENASDTDWDVLSQDDAQRIEEETSGQDEQSQSAVSRPLGRLWNDVLDLVGEMYMR